MIFSCLCLVFYFATVLGAKNLHEQNVTRTCQETIASPNKIELNLRCKPYRFSHPVQNCRDFHHDKLVYFNSSSRYIGELKLSNFKNSLQIMKIYGVTLSEKCKDTIFNIYCHWYFPACDFTTDKVLKQPLCRESCNLMYKLCRREFQIAKSFNKHMNMSGYELINCSHLPSRNVSETPTCYYHPALNSELDKLESVDCYYGNGMGYRGKRNTTRSGYTCQQWSSQCPHRHGYAHDKYKVLVNASNWCRNPGGDAPNGPWCYTTNSSQRWDYCNVPECPNPGPTSAPNLYQTKVLANGTVSVAWKPVPKKFLHGSLKGFIVIYRKIKNSSQYKNFTRKVSPNVNQTYLHGLEPESLYGISVSAFTEHGIGPTSNVMYATTLPQQKKGKRPTINKSPNNTSITEERIPPSGLSESEIGGSVIAGVAGFAIIIAIAILLLVRRKLCCQKNKEDISPYATVKINQWLRENMVYKGGSKQSKRTKSSSDTSLEYTKQQPYENLDSDGEPLAGKLAGSVEWLQTYVNQGTRYQNTCFSRVPLAGEFALLCFSDENLHYDKLNLCKMRRNSFSGITEGEKALYDKLNRVNEPISVNLKRCKSLNESIMYI